ncbi:hypothetical protein QWZ08_13220 [Ferruginibacter paludis]|uniref:hypothetical protein n=1 Tax=Ferruginibacter paludis TaxID=1310417 RepID=UPI0025B36D31|nr:hypothetical protein [Ferruginibacter paludis]MDN3656599.1 hypothetical protein [Ferruginibacter paludis]
MKQSKFITMLFGTALVYLLISCHGGGSKEKTGADTTSAAIAATATTPATATPANSIITIPQNMLVVRHKVQNFAKWLGIFEADDSARTANGLHKYVIGRSFPDTNMVLVALKADDIVKAKAFIKAPGLKTAMQKGGVNGTPIMSIVTATWQDTASISSVIRSIATFSVKDFNAWQKEFETGRQERMDNAITDRIISHDADDTKKVSLVAAISDTAKAFAYYKSDALKKRREAGGVIGTPDRFLFRIVKRY